MTFYSILSSKLGILMIFGFALVSCDNEPTENNGGKKTKFEGTWIGSSGLASMEQMQLTFSENNFIENHKGRNDRKGTFTFTEME